VLEMEPWALFMPGKCSTIEPNPSPCFLHFLAQTTVCFNLTLLRNGSQYVPVWSYPSSSKYAMHLSCSLRFYRLKVRSTHDPKESRLKGVKGYFLITSLRVRSNFIITT
jgi:hypothetical protein